VPVLVETESAYDSVIRDARLDREQSTVTARYKSADPEKSEISRQVATRSKLEEAK
jgi:hypothetical protein